MRSGMCGAQCHTCACGLSPTGSTRWNTVELATIAIEEDAKVGVLAELRFREKQMGTTWSAHQDMRIRYVEPAEEPVPAGVTSLEEYRDL
jgi:hypothetical protein